MLSKKLSSLIRSLHLKKYRKKENQFLVEGAKSVLEVVASDYKVKTIVATPMFLAEYQSILKEAKIEFIEAKPDELTSLGTLQTNHTALAVVEMKPHLALEAGNKEWCLLLDDVGDPGNLGTIIRIADWYGIHKLICSETTVDFYNPKVIAASKGSFCRTQLYYTDLVAFLGKQQKPVFGADLNGESVHDFDFPESGYLLMGSESHGISAEISAFLSKRITIPAFGGAESLNVAVATAIICDNLRRKLPGI